jgi:excisionase family DNA binding protein
MSTDYRAKGVAKADVPRLFWSVREFATTTGLSIDTVYRLMHAGELAHTKIAGEYRIPNAELDRLTAAAFERRPA